MMATKAMPAKAVKSTAEVDGAATAAMNENLAPPRPLLAFKFVDWNMETWNDWNTLATIPSLAFLLIPQSKTNTSCLIVSLVSISCFVREAEAFYFTFCLSLKSHCAEREGEERERGREREEWDANGRISTPYAICIWYVCWKELWVWAFTFISRRWTAIMVKTMPFLSFLITSFKLSNLKLTNLFQSS